MQLNLFDPPARHMWRTTEIRTAAQLRAAGLTTAQIAARLGAGLTATAVQKQLERAGARAYGQAA